MTAWVLMVLGLAALITGAELLVRGGSRLAARLGIPPIVVGVTVVSLGTSTPELAIGVQSALQDDGTLALGNIAGTNTVNLLLILGLSALIRPLAMKTETLRFDLPVMSAAALLLLVMAWDGVLSRTEGVIMILGAALYAGWIVVWTRRESQAVKDEYEHELGVPTAQRTRRAVAVNVTLLVAGIVVIVVGADLLVDGAVQIAQTFGVSDAVIGLTIVAVGTAERRQLVQLLGRWDTPLLTALGGGGLRRFSALDQAVRERVLLSWCDSRLPQRRTAFQALRKGSLFVSYMLPKPDGSPNPVWEAMGFPGPLGKKADAPPKPLKPLEIAADTDLSCDVVVVGSGAGGGTAAGVLAAAGLDVVVLEMGGYYDDADFDGSEVTALTGLYLGAPQASHDQSVGLLAGSCLGGGTVVNYSTSFRTPDDVREEWASHGVPTFAGEEYTRSLDAVVERLGVNLDHNKPSRRDEIMRAGCDALGWHIDAMPRNVRGCEQGKECGYCGLGCRIGAKQSVTKTWLADAAGAGARLVVNTRAERVIIESGAARGIEARTLDGRRVTVRSRAVVAACGALHTPALLRRSGLDNANIGKHLKLHPATVVMARYEDEVRPWEGVMQALYSDQHRDLDNGYGVKYETAPIQPHLAVTFVPWRGARVHRELMEATQFTSGIGVLVRDRDGGEVRVGRDGQPVVRYHLSAYDVGHLRTGLDAPRRYTRRPARSASSRATPAGSATSPAATATGRGSWPIATPPATGPASACWAPSTSWARRAWAARPPARPATQRARPGTCATSWSATARPSPRPQA